LVAGETFSITINSREDRLPVSLSQSTRISEDLRHHSLCSACSQDEHHRREPFTFQPLPSIQHNFFTSLSTSQTPEKRNFSHIYKRLKILTLNNQTFSEKEKKNFFFLWKSSCLIKIGKWQTCVINRETLFCCDQRI
jgi:hypothetical protein